MPRRQSLRHMRQAHEAVKQKQQEIAAPYAEGKPSEVTEVHWIYAVRKADDYQPTTENSGKWLVFVDVERVDEVWAAIKAATEAGKLGDRSKVASNRRSRLATSDRERVICVYTYDWTDEQDARRVREELRHLGIVWKIAYKADEDTMKGVYRATGYRGISKYYE